ncbi:MAG: tetratricopeptide repeat protein [Pirellulales bacterium]|nr:tetratricopeptide repeat protein [Pirellulales bacterium]
MRFRTVRWLWQVCLAATVVIALSPRPLAAQNVAPPDEKVGVASDAAVVQPIAPDTKTRNAIADIGLSPVDDPSPPLQPTPTAESDAPAGPGETPVAADQPPLEPIAETTDSGPVAIEPASFKGVVPGATTMAEVETAWGPPKEINKQGAVLMGLYAVEPFDHVEVSYAENKVASVIIRFDRSFPANAVAEQLELNNIRPVLVSNDVGEILGQVYPERGVLFAFEPSEQPRQPSMKVAQIILEPITAEPFVLRAETRLGDRYDWSLADLQEALKLQPGNARAHWLHSRVLVATGQYDKAVAASGQAVRLEPDNAKYRVTRARILGQVGRLDEAIRESQKAIDTSQQRPHTRARALCMLGDLLASGESPDYRQAIRHHMEAVKVADALTSSRYPAVRLAAKEVLVDAHLGAAHDIAWGQWKEKDEAVTRWLARADAFAQELVENEGGSQEHLFRVGTRALAACVGVRGNLDPEQWTQQAIQNGEQLIAATKDPLRKAQLQWDLGMALYDTLQIYQMRNDHDTALKYGERAIEYLEQGDGSLQQSVSSSYLLGRLYFRLGAIHAIRDQNHRAAITWFEKAVPLLETSSPKEAAADVGRHGETFVSMGVSFWETGQYEKAIELTQRGIEWMEQAVKQGALDQAALAVPYKNLAAMHRQLGQDVPADRFEELAEKAKQTVLR